VTNPTDTPRLLLSTEHVAQALTVSPRFVKNLIYSGALPSCKVGRLRRIYIGDLWAWVEALRDDDAQSAGDERLPGGSQLGTVRRSGSMQECGRRTDVT
jgi:excisionase family DNA binding protein